MKSSRHLWAIGYESMERANHVRDEVTKLGRDKHYLLLEDVAVVVRHPDGSFTLDREQFPAAPNILGCTLYGGGFPRRNGARRSDDGRGGWRDVGRCRHRRRGRGLDRSGLHRESEDADEAGDLGPLRPGQRGRDGHDTARNTRPRWDRV